ncbi:permease [Marinobacterium jannaschii]|uniref:permease n=1 Tax=Marinobacterium jannaschii TaxID=64970 RepID=UPI000487490C|nr:permease [Marinobacterium jannaschii]
MQQSSLTIALEEFVHVGGALVVIIAVVALLTGIMREFIPQDRIQKKLIKHERFGSLIGAAFGTLTPFCSASVVPVSMGMAEMGVSLSTIFGFLISAPLCNFVVVGMITAVFGWQVAALYFLITFSAAVISGFLIGRSPLRNEVKRGEELLRSKASAPNCSATNTPEPASNSCSAEAVMASMTPQLATALPAGSCAAAASQSTTSPDTKQKLQNAARFARALFTRIIPYVLIGAAISAVSAAYLPADMVERYVGGDTWYSVPLAAVIGVPLYLRIEMALPLLKVLIAKGMSMGASMALIIGGTGASLPEIALISSVLKPKAVVAFVLTVLMAAVIGGMVFNSLT